MITVDSDERVSERRMQRICLKITKHDLTSLLICVSFFPLVVDESRRRAKCRLKWTKVEFTEAVEDTVAVVHAA